MKTVVVIGGIGSGKSAVSAMFADRGAGVISLDQIGHRVLEMPEVKRELRRAFGADVFDARGEVARPLLAQAAFDTPEHTERLNAITHPVIMAACMRRIAELGAAHPMVAVEVTSGEMTREALSWADAIVAVSADEDVRVARAVARGNQAEADVKARLVLQPSDAQREAIADFVIRNNGSLDEVRAQVDAVWSALLG